MNRYIVHSIKKIAGHEFNQKQTVLQGVLC